MNLGVIIHIYNLSVPSGIWEEESEKLLLEANSPSSLIFSADQETALNK